MVQDSGLRVALVLLTLWLSALNASAQTNVESNAGVQLDFLNPGARSLALGSAFVALADDATAAFTNPAGLRSISRMELSAEGRVWSFGTPFTSGGRLSGSVTNLGSDVTTGLTTGTSNQSATSLSFLSFVYPGSRWAVAAYRHQLASFKYAAQSTGPFYSNLDGRDGRLFPYQATLNVDIARYGVSGSFKVSENVAIGAGLYVYDFALSSVTNRYAVNPNSPQFYAAPNYSAVPLQVDTQTGDQRKVGANVGILLSPHPKFQVGAVYRRGADFDMRTTDTRAGASATVGETFAVPDVVTVGILVKPADAVRVTIDYSRVRYSEIEHTFSPLFPALPGYTASAQDFKVNDANEIHAGIEYLLANLPKPLALRAGTWTDPDHGIRFEPSNQQAADPYNVAVFRAGSTVIHGTFGAGIAIGQVEINAAGDISSRTKTASVSTVVRF
jgi:long-chain fatty acid transport protein